MASAPDTPIVVNGTALPTTIFALLRYLIVAGGTYAVGRGWVSADSLPGIGTLVVTVATLLYGLWKTHSTKQSLIVAATAAPNSVARVV